MWRMELNKWLPLPLSLPHGLGLGLLSAGFGSKTPNHDPGCSLQLHNKEGQGPYPEAYSGWYGCACTYILVVECGLEAYGGVSLPFDKDVASARGVSDSWPG